MTYRIHCSYHKCLTVYFMRVLSGLYNWVFFLSRGYRHFTSRIDEFYLDLNDFKVASVNNHPLDFDRLGPDFLISRFIRDPRDLVVSGYFYHRRGAEAWARIVDPVPEDWTIVNGSIPENMGQGHSFASYLEDLSQDEGLMAEIEFRKRHFDSMRQWPLDDPRIKLFRYEDIIGREAAVFRDLLAHYRVSALEQRLGSLLAVHFSAKKQRRMLKHIRNPAAGQWKEHFTPRVEAFFNQHYADILKRYGYE